MTKTHTPLIVEGKIYVVVDAPDIWSYNKPGLDALIERLTKYPTLEQHAPYWKERIGQPMKEWGLERRYNDNTIYAIPPQQKQVDEWAQFIDDVVKELDLVIDPRELAELIKYLRNNYSITKK